VLSVSISGNMILSIKKEKDERERERERDDACISRILDNRPCKAYLRIKAV